MDEARQLLPLVIFNCVTIFKNASNSLDEWNELVEILPKFRGIGDCEDNVSLRLLWKAAPAVNVIEVTL